MHAFNPLQSATSIHTNAVDADIASSAITCQRLLWQHAVALRCRAAELADSLQRFRERQAQIDAGSTESSIGIPPVDAGWLTRPLAA